MARLPYVDLATVPGTLGEMVRARPPLNLYRFLPHAPEAALGFLALGRALLTQTSLDPGLRELAILRVGARSNAAYEVHQHRRVARKAGLSETEIEAALDLHGDGSTLSARQRLVLEFADAVLRDVKASSALNERVIAELSGQGWLELLMTVGYYMLVSRVLENAEIEIETDDPLGQARAAS
jgi:alkylhydroperoxidase family enzyme